MRVQLPNTNIILTDDDVEIKRTIKKIQKEVGDKFPQYKMPDTTITLKDWVFVHLEPSAKAGDVILFFIRYYAKAGDSGYLSFELNNFFTNRKEIDVLIRIFQNEADSSSEKTLTILNALKGIASLNQLAESGILSTPPPSLN
jgi:hypothetical protein